MFYQSTKTTSLSHLVTVTFSTCVLFCPYHLHQFFSPKLLRFNVEINGSQSLMAPKYVFKDHVNVVSHFYLSTKVWVRPKSHIQILTPCFWRDGNEAERGLLNKWEDLLDCSLNWRMRLLASVSMPDLFTDQQVGVESFRKATERGESMASTWATRASGHPCGCIITIYP